MADLKTKRITIKVTEKMHTAFKEYCDKKEVDVSDDLRSYIKKCIDEIKE